MSDASSALHNLSRHCNPSVFAIPARRTGYELGAPHVHWIGAADDAARHNAPFRIYWAYNALRLNSSTAPPVPVSRSMFPCATCQNGAAGTYTFLTAQDTLGLTYTLREPRKTFRFSVATTF